MCSNPLGSLMKSPGDTNRGDTLSYISLSPTTFSQFMQPLKDHPNDTKNFMASKQLDTLTYEPPLNWSKW